MKYKANKKTNNVSRRDFLKASAAVSLASLTAINKRAFAAGTDKLRVGLIGCGNRGTGAAMNCVNAAGGVEIVAMADMFEDRLDNSLKELRTNEEKKVRWDDAVPWQNADRVKVTDEMCFAGFDAYKKVLSSDVDLVILATPPHFRPIHLKAAIEAGKHVFMEKPVAVDPIGVRSVIASSESAKERGLAVVAGTQRRHQKHYLEIIRRIREGDIGEIVAGQCYWLQGFVREWGFWHKRQPEWSDMEWQLRNWYYFTWLSGDHIVEQHVHNIDVINWAMGSHPDKCIGMGGRQVRTEPEYGNIYDHFAIEFEYPNGARILSMAEQIEGCAEQVSERLAGTKGFTYTDKSRGYIKGQNPFQYKGRSPNPYVQEHADLIDSIRRGRPLNEGRCVAESTLTAIMGRMSAYTGRALKWDWIMNESKLDLSPPKYEFGELPVEPVAVPGKTRLV